MSTPPPPSSPTASVSPSTVTAKKPQPLPWTHEETLQLIRAYQEKWYTVKRGPLKSSQWEEVAVAVAARCGYNYGEPSKTAVQCRHKMEKLRQRYRTVKKRLRPGARSGWPFFELMESLERGPMPISARPMDMMPRQQQQEEEKHHDHRGGGVADDDDDEENSNKVRSIDYILRRPTFVNRFSGGKAPFLQQYAAAEVAAKRPIEAVYMGSDNGEVVEPPVKMGEIFVGLADEIRDFSKKLTGLESMRMEIMKETEMCWLEMERRRVDMIVQSQQKIVESIATAFEPGEKLGS